MAATIDYSTLTLKDALDLAILIEDEARDRYTEFVDQMFFRFMAANETRHGQQLTAKRQALFGNEPSRMNRDMLWDVEAPEYAEAHAFMSPREAMQVAMRCEIKARDFFVQALVRVPDPDVRHLFEELRDEEVEHEELVRKELAKLPPGPDINPDDYADEPVAQ
ncbi:MAG: Rubrerythrin [Acidobacteria bacterium]|nr:Rubrerythrin [Acidobacteriota bacterium]